MDTRQYPVAPGRDEDEHALPDLRRSRVERAPRLVLPASAGVWAAGEILHLTGGHALEAGVAGVVASAVAYGASGRGRIPSWVTGAVAGTSCWLCAAARFGPLHWWPEAPLTWGAAAAAVFASRWARRHPAVTAAQQHREARAEWLAVTSRRWHMGGSHLLKREDTRLGEVYEVDTTGTGKLASQLPLRSLPEQIAQERGLPDANRVSVTRPRPGRVRVSIRERNPWEHPALHPVIDPDPEIDLSGPCSIRQPAVIGIDPDTGNPFTVTLVGSGGAKNISIVALRGSGKTILLNDISERVTAARDALLVRINVSIKGPGERERWGPACHLTAFGTAERKRAVAVLKILHGVMEWRAAQYATKAYVPTPEDPAIVVILDEMGAAARTPGVKKLLEDLAETGRELGIVLVWAALRGTADYTSPKMRAQVDTVILGKVSRPGEAYHAAPNVAANLPDMTNYGEGASGVFAVADDADASMGRAFLLDSGPSADIARERAFTQPGLPAALAEALGDGYADLLATEVFAEWAREQAAGNSVPVVASPDVKDGLDSPLAALATLVRDGQVKVDDPDTEQALLNGLEIAERNAFKRWEDELGADMDDDTRENIQRLSRSAGEKITRAREQLAETAARPKPDSAPDPDAMDAFVRQRWQQVASTAQIPDEHRPVLLDMLRSGTTGSQVAKKLDVSAWTARTYLERLRDEGAAKVVGEKRTAKWVLAEPGDGDSQ